MTASDMTMTAPELTTANTMRVLDLGMGKKMNVRDQAMHLDMGGNSPVLTTKLNDADLKIADSMRRAPTHTAWNAARAFATNGRKNMALSAAQRGEALTVERKLKTANSRAMKMQAMRAATRMITKPAIAAKADPKGNLGHSLAQLKPRNSLDKKANKVLSASVNRQLQKTPESMQYTVRAMPVSMNTRAAAFAQTRRNGAAPNRGMYATLNAGLKMAGPQMVAPTAVSILEAAKKTVQVAKATLDVPKPTMARRPSMRRLRLMTPGMAA